MMWFITGSKWIFYCTRISQNLPESHCRY